MVRGKNVPNGLLRRATQSSQKSIGDLSNYNGTTGSISHARASLNAHYQAQAAHNSDGGTEHYRKAHSPKKPKHAVNVNPPAIIANAHQASLTKNKSFSNGTSSSLNATKATLMKMIQDKGLSSSSHSNLHAHHHST